MPKGPKGEKRPADTNKCAVQVAKIATGEMEDDRYETPNRKKSGMAGAKARSEGLSSERRRQIAKDAAKSRWNQERRRAMTNTQTACEALAERDEKKRASGLIDVKYFVRNRDEALKEEVCAEVNRLDEAIENEEFEPLVFNDRHN